MSLYAGRLSGARRSLYGERCRVVRSDRERCLSKGILVTGIHAYEVGIAPGVYRVVAPLIKARVTSDPVLDVGCGGGRLTIDLAQVLKRTVVGLDLAVLQVRRLARHAGRSRAVAAVRASAEQLPFPDRCFGAVISSCALKHWADPRRGVRECARVARVGGTVVTAEVDGAATTPEMRAFARLTRLPVGLREAYVRFAMRTVVEVAPSRDGLLELVRDAELAGPSVDKVDGLPFLVAVGTAR